MDEQAEPSLHIERIESAWIPVIKIINQSMPAEAIDRARFARQVLLDPNFDPAGSLCARTALKEKSDTESTYLDRLEAKRGYILAIARKNPLENSPADSDGGYITLFGVKPDARRRGIGTALLAAAEEFLRSRGCRSAWISPYAPGYFTPGVDVEAYAEGLNFLKNRGYSEAYRPLAMERSLWAYQFPFSAEEIIKGNRPKFRSDSSTPPEPRRISMIRTDDPSLEFENGRFARFRPLQLLSFVEQSFPGDWARVIRECILDILDGAHDDRLQIAFEYRTEFEPRIVGFSHYRGERFGPIGVHPDYRERGIGQVLTHLTLRAQQQAGFRTSWFLWTDDQTADRLYKPAGFREVRRFAVLRKEL